MKPSRVQYVDAPPAPASCSAAVLPPDGVRGAMLALSAALEACKKADWTAAEGMTRMNALSLVDLIVSAIGREQNSQIPEPSS